MSCPECKDTGWVTLLIDRSRCNQGCVPPELRNQLNPEASNEKTERENQKVPTTSTSLNTVTGTSIWAIEKGASGTFTLTNSGGSNFTGTSGGDITITGGDGTASGGSFTINSSDNPGYWTGGNSDG